MRLSELYFGGLVIMLCTVIASTLSPYLVSYAPIMYFIGGAVCLIGAIAKRIENKVNQ